MRKGGTSLTINNGSGKIEGEFYLLPELGIAVTYLVGKAKPSLPSRLGFILFRVISNYTVKSFQPGCTRF